MSGLSFEFKENSHPNGFIIQTGDEGFEFLFPRLFKSNEYGLINPTHCLFIFSHDLIYKFQCEDIDTSNFIKTKEYLKVYYQIYSLKKKPWFPNTLEKLALNSRDEFINAFYYQLIQDLEKYDSFITQELVIESKKSFLKLKKKSKL